ncbi:MAG: hypothetical protein R3C28_21655 [Pirellulaceae bacterium]
MQFCKDENVISPEMVAVYRSKTPTQRLQIAFDMWRSARKIALAAVRQQHPQWSDDRQQAEVARRMSDGLV